MEVKYYKERALLKKSCKLENGFATLFLLKNLPIPIKVKRKNKRKGTIPCFTILS